MKRALYVCVEGVEGVGKTTQVELLATKLQDLGYKVLKTKEPGTPHLPLTMKMRELMLSNEFDEHLTAPAREFISQAIRSIHFEKLIFPSLLEYDFIIQDRGLLSSYSYGVACGNNLEDLRRFAKISTTNAASAFSSVFHSEVQYIPECIYDKVILLKGDVRNGLDKATSSKKEFASGDAMESKGFCFIDRVSSLMNDYSSLFNVQAITVDNKNIEEVNAEMIKVLLGNYNEKQ